MVDEIKYKGKSKAGKHVFKKDTAYVSLTLDQVKQMKELCERIIQEEPIIMTTGNQKQYWYRRYIGECPVCGRDKSYKERVCGEKPTDPKDRIVYLSDTQTYDYCEEST